MPVAPAFGGKLKRTMASFRSATGVRRSATMRPTRAASIAARSGWARMSRPCSGPAPVERPPNTIGPVDPSSSGIATIMVASTGIRPRSDDSHCSRVWNSTACAAR